MSFLGKIALVASANKWKKKFNKITHHKFNSCTWGKMYEKYKTPYKEEYESNTSWEQCN